MIKLKYIVTGTGRSGTVYMARFLTSVGVPCTHEAVFTHNGLEYAKEVLAGEKEANISWVSRSKFDKGTATEIEPWLKEPAVAESSYMAAPYIGHEEFKDSRIIHVVRDPVLVVNSFCHYIEYFKGDRSPNKYEDFIYTHLPFLDRVMSQYDRACLYWVKWNQMVESHKPDYTHKVEGVVDQLMDFLGKSGPYFSDRTINSFRKPSEGRFEPSKIQNKDIYDQFMEQGRKYGYSMKSKYLLM